MLKTIFGFAPALVLALGALLPAAAQPPQPKPEELPPFPAVDKDSKLVPNPKMKTIVMEVRGGKVARAGIACEVCLREGPLEQFLCKKGTKEHEAIVRADMDAEFVHETLLLIGATPGTPTQFVNPKTEMAEYKPATGSRVSVGVHYKHKDKLHTHPAQEWVWDTKKKAAMQHGWVFAGSVFIRDPDNPNAKPHYGANAGDIFSISNFPYSTLEIPVSISKDEAQLSYEARTDRIPPLGSKVWVLLEVAPEKK